mgnify:CR=1 FL=1
MTTARIFQSGNSQAIRLPKEFRFHCDEVEIFRRGDEIILRAPGKGLRHAFDALADCPADYRVDGRDDALPQEREPLD